MVANIYWPQDQWVALLTAIFIVACAVLLPGFWSRIAIFLALIFGYAISWLFDRVGKVHSALPGSTVKTDHFRINWDGLKAADWIGFPHKTTIGPDGKELVGWHTPSFSLTFILLVLPGVIALLAENTGHVKAVGEMTGEDLDPYLGRAFIGDSVGTVVASSVGGSPTTTYAENIGVMAATRVYSTAAYYVAAIVAIPARVLPEVRRHRECDTRWRARRHHRGPVRHDRPARRQDLGREPGRLRQPGEPGAAGCPASWPVSAGSA